MEPDESLPDSRAAELLSLLWRVNHELEMLSKRMLRVHGVTGPQRMVLNIIARRPGVSASEISKAARIHPSTLSGILDRLERGTLAMRSRDSADGRKARFEVTEGGQRIHEIRSGTVQAAVLRSLAALRPSEQVVVVRWLRAFGEELEKERLSMEGMPAED